LTLMQLTIVTPTFNEKDNVCRLVERIHSAAMGINHEILVVDDDSPDRTWKVVDELTKSDPRVRLLRRIGKRGLSQAVIDGFSDARGELVACIDADLQHDATILGDMYRVLLNGADFAVGSRYVSEGKIENWSWFRRQESAIATKLAMLLIGIEIRDPMSGYFMMRRIDFLTVRQELSGEGFKILLELLSALRPLKVTEITYTFGQRHAGKSKLDSRIVLAYLRQLWRLSSIARKSVPKNNNRKDLAA